MTIKPRRITFDDVLIKPRRSSIESRSNVDISSKIFRRKIGLPVVSANMDTITESEMATTMFKNGGLGAIHRFGSRENRKSMVAKTDGLCLFSVGLDDSLDYIQKMWLRHTNIFGILVDVAHGHQDQVLEKIENIDRFRDEHGSSIRIIAGNVATRRGARDLYEHGVDAIKVGVGPGSACSTRIKTGVGVPQLSAIESVYRATKNYKPRPTIIADGGIRSPGDVAKAIAAGADAVMIGGMFAGTNETPDPSKFRGMASREAAEDNGKTHYASEGVSVDVEAKGSVVSVLKEIEGGLRSALSYVGARNLQEFKRRSQFVEISRASQLENLPHIQV